MSGCRAKRASTAWDWAPEGVLARRVRLRGRWERGSAEVGMDSGMGSDIVIVGGKVWCQGILRRGEVG